MNQEAMERAQWGSNDSKDREGDQIKDILGEWQNHGMDAETDRAKISLKSAAWGLGEQRLSVDTRKAGGSGFCSRINLV